jgi:hypothetical protein
MQRGPVTRVCCPSCRLRFTPAATAFLTVCPECGEALRPIAVQDAIGFRLFAPDEPQAMPPVVHGNAAASPEPPRAVMNEWNVRLLQAAVRRAREQAAGRPHRD